MSMRPWASLASLLSSTVDNLDALDKAAGTKEVPRQGSQLRIGAAQRSSRRPVSSAALTPMNAPASTSAG
jgi:hypothetical protein